jgi:group I intron endonuclease
MQSVVDIFSAAVKLENVRGVSGIYRITSPSGRIYVGQAQCISKRWSSHACAAKSHANKLLRSSFEKYGVSAHTFEVVEVVTDMSIIDAREQAWIDAAFALGDRCMNMSPTAGSVRGIKRSEEVRAKMPDALRAGWAKPGARERLSAALKKSRANPEVIQRMSIAQKASHAMPNIRAGHSEAMKRSHANPETKARHSASLVAAHARPDTKARHSAALKASHSNPVTRAKISANSKAHMATPGVREHMSETAKARMQKPEMRSMASLLKFKMTVSMNSVRFESTLSALRSIDAFMDGNHISIEECRRIRDELRKRGKSSVIFRGETFSFAST